VLRRSGCVGDRKRSTAIFKELGYLERVMDAAKVVSSHVVEIGWKSGVSFVKFMLTIEIILNIILEFFDHCWHTLLKR
jgi:hypothetical protein